MTHHHNDDEQQHTFIHNHAAKMPPKAAPQQLSPQDVPVVFQRYRTELQNLAQKIGELESEMDEHA